MWTDKIGIGAQKVEIVNIQVAQELRWKWSILWLIHRIQFYCLHIFRHTARGLQIEINTFSTVIRFPSSSDIVHSGHKFYLSCMDRPICRFSTCWNARLSIYCLAFLFVFPLSHVTWIRWRAAIQLLKAPELAKPEHPHRDLQFKQKFVITRSEAQLTKAAVYFVDAVIAYLEQLHDVHNIKRINFMHFWYVSTQHIESVPLTSRN